ncbi:unnamed protein product [Pylaiella littoralis]
MSSTVRAARQISCRVSPGSFPRVAATRRSRLVKLAAPASSSASNRGRGQHVCFRPVTCTTYSSTHCNRSSRCSSATFGKVLLLRRAVFDQEFWHMFSQPLRSLSCGRAAMTRAEGLYSRSAAIVGYTRAFGGQSVVPWELALFLVEEMKAEMVQPGAVVYTAALAECRWAGEQRHVDYLLQEMEAEGLSIVPGIPGATDNELPPSQAPPLFGKLPETPPGMSKSNPQHAPLAAAPTPSTAVATMQAAARTADAALVTVETMWAREEHDPSPATCRAALDACAAGGQWERALSMVRDAAMAITADGDAGNSGGGEEEEDLEEGSVSRRVETLALAGKWNKALLLVQGEEGLSEHGGAGGEGWKSSEW